ncbi:30S ribosomal protein S10 [Mycoplasmopsis californica]|uniref:Small ribosomal subunit protein uS10 n=1 Tax=Mycoplasmopsis equigenitalium TaxID=114883 RepID=A0ABY5J1J4_9BACT|nr:30S ribosomal protein S10 [Mycoplasmopsis equigenitalium]UUD37084.1 30S ribosomal protein S10 [Mycoplasmopsis equigenitalium]VEU69615.1 30S ribosomal protein S10 [Mycoplasmopsis californica]
MKKITIKIKGFEHELVDMTAKKLVTIAQDAKCKFSGPVPLPTKREIFTILRSVHINKKSREQFEQKTHQRLLILIEPSAKLVESLRHTELPFGVEVTIK